METPQLVDKNLSCHGCGPQKVPNIKSFFADHAIKWSVWPTSSSVSKNKTRLKRVSGIRLEILK